MVASYFIIIPYTMAKKRTLNELRQTKEYYKHPYESGMSVVKKIKELIKQFPNNADLGAEIKKLFNEY